MERVIALVVATLASVQAFGTVDKPEASPGPIRIVTQTESFDEDPFEKGDEYALSIYTNGREYCRCQYKPMSLPNGRNGKRSACTTAADWLKENSKAGIKDQGYVKMIKGPKPNKTPPREAEDAWDNLKGCRYRANKKTVYFNRNNAADGFEGPPTPLPSSPNNYKNICVPTGEEPSPNNPLCGQQDPGPQGYCNKVGSKTQPVGGCCAYDNRMASCPLDKCDWVSTPTQGRGC